MAVTKLWAVHDNLWRVMDYASNPKKTDGSLYSRSECQDLSNVIDYATNNDKTEKHLFVSGINCYPEIARDQFITVKQDFGKTDKVQAYHGYMSFKQGEVTPEQAHQIGIEFAKEVWGDRFQVIVATHLNTDNLHNHFVINSVSFIDGKKLADEKKRWYSFRKIADRICEEYKLSVIEQPQYRKKTYYQNKMEQAGMPTVKTLAMSAIDEAISHSHTIREMRQYLSAMGYSCDFNPNHKYWTITPQGYKRAFRIYKFGEEYTNERILARIMENDLNGIFQPFQRATYIPNHKYDVLRVKGSLYNLYLYYCYRLGYFNKPNKQKQLQDYNRLHYLLREDLQKVDKFSQEARLLGENHIDTDQQLNSYKQQLIDRKDKLLNLRKSLKNEKRTVNLSEVRLSRIEEEISAINQELKTIYREISLCEDIANRSAEINYKVEQIKADDESPNQNNRKEHNRNEFIR